MFNRHRNAKTVAIVEYQQEIVAQATAAGMARLRVFRGAFIQPIKQVTYSNLTVVWSTMFKNMSLLAFWGSRKLYICENLIE